MRGLRPGIPPCGESLRSIDNPVVYNGFDNQVDYCEDSHAPQTERRQHPASNTTTSASTGPSCTTSRPGPPARPVLLVHGFPETWWVFHKLIPLLSEHHRVFAVDLRGFGDSAPRPPTTTTALTAATDLVELIAHLDLGPVHLTGQDISGPTTFRVAATHPELVRSFTAIETGLPGFGVETLADVTHGGAWHIGVLAAPGIPEMLLDRTRARVHRRVRDPLPQRDPRRVHDDDIDELARSYARPDAFRGAAGLYRSLLGEADEIRRLAAHEARNARPRGRGRLRRVHPEHHAPGRDRRDSPHARRHRPLRGDGGPRPAR